MVRCKRCGREIEFRQNENGRWTPYDQNGQNHFVTCPYAKEFRGLHQGQSINEKISKDKWQKPKISYKAQQGCKKISEF